MATKLLVVEDDESSRALLVRRLRLEGYDVLAAADGIEAMAVAAQEAPEIILMDLAMPILDGWEATRRLKADPRTSRARVVAVTAYALPADLERALAAGCDAVATKPVDFRRLSACLDGLLRGDGKPGQARREDPPPHLPPPAGGGREGGAIASVSRGGGSR